MPLECLISFVLSGVRSLGIPPVLEWRNEVIFDWLAIDGSPPVFVLLVGIMKYFLAALAFFIGAPNKWLLIFTVGVVASCLGWIMLSPNNTSLVFCMFLSEKSKFCVAIPDERRPNALSGCCCEPRLVKNSNNFVAVLRIDSVRVTGGFV